MSAIKTGTEGTGMPGLKGGIDLKATGKWMEKSAKEEKERVMKKAEVLGPQKAIEKQKQLKDARENIKEQAEKRLEKETEQITKDYETAKNDLSKARESFEAAKGTEYEFITRNNLEIATTAFGNTETALKKFNNEHEKKLKDEEEKVAEEIGIIPTTLADGTKSYLKTIENEIEDIEKDIIKGEAERNKYIAGVASQGFLGGLIKTGAFPEAKKKLVSSLRAQKGKYNANKEDFWKNIQKAAKEAGIETEEKKPKAEEEKEEGEKPKVEVQN